MDVKEAVKKAKRHLSELFSGETISHVGLEEVVFDDASNCWKITVGFFRPWDQKLDAGNPLFALTGKEYRRRTYKVVEIDDESGEARSLTNRSPATAE